MLASMTLMSLCQFYNLKRIIYCLLQSFARHTFYIQNRFGQTVFTEKLEMIDFQILESFVVEIQIIDRFSIKTHDQNTTKRTPVLKDHFCPIP